MSRGRASIEASALAMDLWGYTALMRLRTLLLGYCASLRYPILVGSEWSLKIRGGILPSLVEPVRLQVASCIPHPWELSLYEHN